MKLLHIIFTLRFAQSQSLSAVCETSNVLHNHVQIVYARPSPFLWEGPGYEANLWAACMHVLIQILVSLSIFSVCSITDAVELRNTQVKSRSESILPPHNNTHRAAWLTHTNTLASFILTTHVYTKNLRTVVKDAIDVITYVAHLLWIFPLQSGSPAVQSHLVTHLQCQLLS